MRLGADSARSVSGQSYHPGIAAIVDKVKNKPNLEEDNMEFCGGAMLSDGRGHSICMVVFCAECLAILLS